MANAGFADSPSNSEICAPIFLGVGVALFPGLRRSFGDQEFLKDLFSQALIAVTELGRLLSCVAKVGVSDPGLGFAEIDASSRHFVFKGRIGTLYDDAIHRMAKNSLGILACWQKQALRKSVDRILREMIGRRKVHRLKHDKLLDLPATTSGSATSRLPFERRQIFLRVEAGHGENRGHGGCPGWEQMHSYH